MFNLLKKLYLVCKLFLYGEVVMILNLFINDKYEELCNYVIMINN